MLKDLVLSVASGLIVAIILEFIRGRNRKEEGMTQSMPPMKPLPPLGSQSAPKSGAIATTLRMIAAILGGLGVAFLAASLLRPEGIEIAPGSIEMAALTVAGTLICWLILLSMPRRR